jgi:diadenosine tetraphosphate (Ap4A) HIT family hydrolase
VKRLSKQDALVAVERERVAGCTACALLALEPIVESAHAIAILDRYACRPGHVLVLLRRHAEHVAALAWSEYADLQQLAWRVSRAIDRVLAPRRIYIAALGSAEPLATSFPHVHLHIVPLADGGEADRPAGVFTWSQGMYVFDDAAEEASLRARLRTAIPDPAA